MELTKTIVWETAISRWQLVKYKNEILVQHVSCSMLKCPHHKKNPPLDSHVKAAPFTKYSSKHTGGRREISEFFVIAAI